MSLIVGLFLGGRQQNPTGAFLLGGVEWENANLRTVLTRPLGAKSTAPIGVARGPERGFPLSHTGEAKIRKIRPLKALLPLRNFNRLLAPRPVQWSFVITNTNALRGL
jgi:hypothetical protein